MFSSGFPGSTGSSVPRHAGDGRDIRRMKEGEINSPGVGGSFVSLIMSLPSFDALRASRFSGNRSMIYNNTHRQRERKSAQHAIHERLSLPLI